MKKEKLRYELKPEAILICLNVEDVVVVLVLIMKCKRDQQMSR